MKEISRAKKVEVALHYLLGATYGEIEQLTGVSHGSIANIVHDLDTGKLDIPGTPFDQLNDLRQLSLDLKKTHLSTSQALLGLSLFEKAHDLNIVPGQFDQWSQLINKFAPPDFPTADFLEAALKLRQSENSEGKTYDAIIEDYKKAKEELEGLKIGITSLQEKGAALSQQVASTSDQVQHLENTKTKLEIKVNELADKAKDLRSKVNESNLARAALAKEIKELQQKKVKLSAEVDGKEESLARLNDIGFQDEDLLRIRAMLERISKETSASQKEVGQRFFQLLSTYKAITELEGSRVALMLSLEDLAEQKFVLTGEIEALENKKAILLGGIGQSAASVMEEIETAGEQAVSALAQQTDHIKGEIDTLFTEALRLTGIVDEMRVAAKKGEETRKGLESFIAEIKGKVRTN
jgi:predicted  nucleic acid-binding Zn-ribbon protein